MFVKALLCPVVRIPIVYPAELVVEAAIVYDPSPNCPGGKFISTESEEIEILIVSSAETAEPLQATKIAKKETATNKLSPLHTRILLL